MSYVVANELATDDVGSEKPNELALVEDTDEAAVLSARPKPVELVAVAAPAVVAPNPIPAVLALAGALVAMLPGFAPNGEAAAGAPDKDPAVRPKDGVVAEVLTVDPNERPSDAVVAGAGPDAARRLPSVDADVVTAADAAGAAAGDPAKHRGA
jgi:hypothetical protein